MAVMDILEQKFGKYAISNLTGYLIAGQMLAYVYLSVYPHRLGYFALNGSMLTSGHLWPLFLFPFMPFDMTPVLMVFTVYLFYIFGTALDTIWGTFRYTAYLLTGFLSLILLSLVFPGEIILSHFLYVSVFLAFARVNPDFLLSLFFVIPVRIKWLAWLTWIGIVISIIRFPSYGIISLFSLMNYWIFLGPDMIRSVSGKKNILPDILAAGAKIRETYMICTICGKTEKDGKIFYYCHQCKPERCYCQDHVHDHAHVVK